MDTTTAAEWYYTPPDKHLNTTPSAFSTFSNIYNHPVPKIYVLDEKLVFTTTAVLFFTYLLF